MAPDTVATGAHVYKICDRAAWEAAQANGRFYGAAVDLEDGFIHLSTAGQIVETAALHFAGRSGLVVLTVPVAPLGEDLRWERSRGLALFPHLYAPLSTDLVAAVHDLPIGPDGRHVFPELP